MVWHVNVLVPRWRDLREPRPGEAASNFETNFHPVPLPLPSLPFLTSCLRTLSSSLCTHRQRICSATDGESLNIAWVTRRPRLTASGASVDCANCPYWRTSLWQGFRRSIQASSSIITICQTSSKGGRDRRVQHNVIFWTYTRRSMQDP